jgi:hypothetical protein
VALVAFLILPVLFIVIAGVVAFSVTITAIADFTTASANLLYKGGALILVHPVDYSFTVLVQDMQSLLAVLGIMIVSGGEIILHIHLEVAMLRYALPQECI